MNSNKTDLKIKRNNNEQKQVGLYIHIPFCDNICSYCAFSKMMKQYSNVDKYLTSLEKEFIEKNIYKYKFDTIFVGGGTPTCLSYEQLTRLLNLINRLDLSNLVEFSFESNAENLSLEKTSLLSKYKVNRVSIGVQSFFEDKIKFLNRYHNYEIVKEAVSNLKKVGINNINLDFIYGTLLDTFELLKDDITKAIALDITHLSLYCLEVEEGTLLYNKKTKIDDDKDADEYEYLTKLLSDNNFVRYEISNFSKENKYRSKHNMKYWKFTDYIGVGLSSTSYIDNKFIVNTKNLTKYLNNSFVSEIQPLTKQEEKEYYIQQNLRLSEGFNLKEYKKRFKRNFLTDYKDKMDLIKDNFDISLQTKNIKLKNNKVYIMNSIISDLL